jgi:carbonic anhydrase
MLAQHQRTLRLTLFALAFLSAPEVPAADWNHDPSSGSGPLRWGQLQPLPEPLFRTCGAILDAPGEFRETGLAQSPIDVPVPAVITTALPPLDFNYRSIGLVVENNGHVVEVPYPPGSQLGIGGDVYELVQFHFHAPGEHSVAGRSYDMELHLVHRNFLGSLAVVGVLLEVCAAQDADCRPNREIDDIMLNAPLEEGEVAVNGRSINAMDLLPADRNYYLYAGSLTTPPCSEGVRWQVLKQPVRVSAFAVERLHAIVSHFPAYEGFGNNNRPATPLNGRPVFESRLP